jgi:hypothetical protein
MGHITKIAAVENANAIWEYDPSLPSNRILEGSLDVIAAVRTIAVKVGWPHVVILKSPYLSLRFKPLDSASNTLRSSSFNASSTNHLGFPSTATFDGGRRSACLNVRTSYERYVVFAAFLGKGRHACILWQRAARLHSG